VILLFSIFFYAWGAPNFIFALLFTTLLTFYLVQSMQQQKTQNARKIFLFLVLLLNVGLLLYFKYANFWVDNWHTILRYMGQQPGAWSEVLLPIGISFYTFQSVTYAVDVYRGTHAPLQKARDYLLYIIMFPQLIAGPIIRFNAIADQITLRKEKWEDRILGFYRFTLGLAKKVLLANVMAAEADLIFSEDLSALDAGTAWMGLMAYTFQIYFDFSGYSDMAIGIGRMMGFKFPENFNNPYTSKSITEFWRRWHMTLGSWMRDYLYIPLGGSKVASAYRLYANLWIVFLISGLWHGASWNFILWGAFHGCFLVLERMFLGKWLKAIPGVFSVGFTFLVVVMGWVLFRTEDLSSALLFYQKLVEPGFSLAPWQENPKFLGSFLVAGLFAFFVLIPKWGEALQQFFYSKTLRPLEMLWVLPGIILLYGLSLGSILNFGFNPFIYFRF
jgi:alginate O-acetyltransferase complex protein AlgI